MYTPASFYHICLMRWLSYQSVTKLQPFGFNPNSPWFQYQLQIFAVADKIMHIA